MKTFYQADLNGYYIGPVECMPDPHDAQNWWNPANSFADEPPAAGQHEVAKRVGVAWVLVPDYRGFEYWLADRTKHTITQGEVLPPTGYLTEDPGPTEEQITAEKQQQALALLEKSDQTIARCYENDVAVPQSWRDYRSALRLIASTGLGVIPTRPEYPPGT